MMNSKELLKTYWLSRKLLILAQVFYSYNIILMNESNFESKTTCEYVDDLTNILY